MIQELQDPVFMKQKVTFLRSVAEDRAVDLPYFGDLQLSDEPATSIEYDDVDELIRGLREVERDGTLRPGDQYWMPRNVYAALLQSSLDTYYRRNDSVVAAADTLFGERLASDPLVSANLLTGPRNVLRHKLADLPFQSEIALLVFLAKLIKFRRGKPSFPDNSAAVTPLAANARVVVFGDWASGIPGASTLARTIWSDFLQPELGKRELHVIHLGDAYYAGLTSDYEHRFRLQWPVPLTYHKDVSSWTIPGNHDMYSGGGAFLTC